MKPTATPRMISTPPTSTTHSLNARYSPRPSVKSRWISPWTIAAYSAVKAAVSTSVAKPLKSTPRTTNGIVSSHFAFQSADRSSGHPKSCRPAPVAMPSRMPQAAVIPTSSRPGRMPATNRSSGATCATIAYRIRGIAGGNSRPSDPDAVSRPSENRAR